MNPLDRNHDGKVDLKDLSNRNTTATGAHNPLDRNHDGRVDARDLAPNAGLNNGLAPGMVQTTTSTTTNQTLGAAHHNPLDRNHDGRVDARDLAPNAGLAGQTTYVQSNQRASLGLVRAEPTIIETIQKDVVVQERIHPVQKEEIQPIIYREREQLDVKQVTQMMHETQIQPTLIQQRELPAERREAIIERGAPIAENYVAASREVDATLRTQVVHAPIVNEVIKKTIIEEIQPVLERDVFQPVLIQNTQAIHEKIIEAPTVYREVREVRELGTRSVGMDSAFVQESLLNNNYQQETLLTHRGLSTSSYEENRMSSQMMQQPLSQGSYELNQHRMSQSELSLNNSNMLATGQVLPAVQSSRPAYAFLPANYVEQKPIFVGSASEYVRAASGMNQATFAHAKNLPTVYPMNMSAQQAAPLAVTRL